MRERPADISDTDVAAALATQWPLTLQELFYLPVGFSGHHWIAIDNQHSRWFVTVSDLTAPWVPDLPAAMATASWLATEAALEFVVAPVPTTAGQIVGDLDTRHARGLDDIAEFLSELRAPHQDTADTRVSWTALRQTLKALPTADQE